MGEITNTFIISEVFIRELSSEMLTFLLRFTKDRNYIYSIGSAIHRLSTGTYLYMADFIALVCLFLAKC